MKQINKQLRHRDWYYHKGVLEFITVFARVAYLLLGLFILSLLIFTNKHLAGLEVNATCGEWCNAAPSLFREKRREKKIFKPKKCENVPKHIALMRDTKQSFPRVSSDPRPECPVSPELDIRCVRDCS